MAPPAPELVHGPVRVTVPATSANLGPGFDCLGLALDLRDELVAEVTGDGLVVEVLGEGAGAVPLDEAHLVVRALREALTVLGAEPAGLHLRCHNVIPHARGLGSSSAAIVGGLVLGRALVADGVDRLTDDALLQLAATMEGHPDNVAPALLGGLVVSGREDDRFWAAQAPVDPHLGAVAFVPGTSLSTESARAVLPAEVPHADAAANTGRAALLVAALGCRPDLLLLATRDYLHQEQRRAAMPESLDLVDALRADGVPAVVSGAGPTVLVLAADASEAMEERCPAGWQVLRLAVSAVGARVE